MKNKLFILFLLAMASCLFIIGAMAVKAADAPQDNSIERLGDYLGFLQNRQSQTYASVPKKVFAFYYPWYATEEYSGTDRHWSGVDEKRQYIKDSTRYPKIGPYDSNDPRVIAYHMKLLKEAGIDGIIVSWWGIGGYEEYPLPTILDEAKKQGIEVSVYLEAEDAQTSEGRIEDTTRDISYLLTEYGRHPAFMKVNGLPVIFAYGRVMGQLSDLEWMESIRNVERNYGRFALLSDGVTLTNVAFFDGAHDYNPLGWVQSAGDNLKGTAESYYGSVVGTEKGAGKISTVTIIPGYDDTKIRKPGAVADRKAGDTYKTLWEAAIKADPQWVLITSFNEWHEGTEIEPSAELGDQYIRLTREYAAKFKESKPVGQLAETAATNYPLTVKQGQIQELRRLYSGKSIGLIPDIKPASSAIIWAAKAGLPIKPVSYKELAEGIHPAKYAVLLFAGGENYTATYKVKGDVVTGIKHYLEKGGALVAAPSLPWPFYYDETGKSAAVTDQLGLNIAGGWEKAPANVTLSFTPNEKVTGGSEKIAFPYVGDQRWRSVKSKSAKDDYLPILSLTDDTGKKYGDGAAIIHHLASAPKNGYTAYIWFRLLDRPGAGDILFWVFKSLGESLLTATGR